MYTNSYLDRQNIQKPVEAIEREEFTELMNQRADAIINQLPKLLKGIIDDEAEILFARAPECIKKEDPVTHQAFDINALRNLLAARISNKLGRGCRFL